MSRRCRISKRWGMWIAVAAVAIGGLASPVLPRAWVVDQKNAQASDAGAGTEASPYLTINKAAQMANAGDTVLVRAGVYREQVSPARGGTSAAYITYQAAPGDTVYIRGSRIWSTGTWTAVAGAVDVYAAVLDQTLFGTYKPFEVALAGGYSGHTCGQVYVDGRPCREVSNFSTLLNTNPYFFSYRTTDKAILLHVPAGTKPADHLIEISTQAQVFAPVTRKLGYIRIKGFVLEHAANQLPENFWSVAANKQAGLVGCMSGNHWIIENNFIRYAKSIGIDCGNEGAGGGGNSGMGYHTIQNNIIAFCGTDAIMGQYSNTTKILDNVICGTGWSVSANTLPECAGIKLHGYANGLVEHNIFIDNNGFRGIWLDAGPTNTRITRNVFINNGGSGVFIELARYQTGVRQVLIDNNITAYTKYQGFASDPEGDGIYMHDASGVTTAHNFCYADTGFSFMMRTVTNRVMYNEVVETSNNKIYNNIFAAGAQGTMHAPYPGTGAVENDEDANLFTDGKAFIATTYGLTPIEQIQTAFATTCPGDSFKLYTDRENRASYAYPPSGKTGQAGGQQYGVILTLAQWQKLMGWGAHDAPNTLSNVSISTANGVTLSLTIGDAPWNTQCVNVTGVDKDFFGTAMPATGKLPGPFQNLQRGANTLTLWSSPIPQLPGTSTMAIRQPEFNRADVAAKTRTGLVRLSAGRLVIDRREWGSAAAIEVFDLLGNRIGTIPTADRSSVDLRHEVRSTDRVLVMKLRDR